MSVYVCVLSGSEDGWLEGLLARWLVRGWCVGGSVVNGVKWMGGVVDGWIDVRWS